ncbi:hypothetical protein F5X99DRAFT_427498 [Biscogniauxia marginata]|nr:hypothetical protein F5X99DRAFT_427498 [Biscogniauxia marginata]
MSVKPLHVQPGNQTAAMSLSYTLPLNDGALGTTPLTHQQPALTLFRADAPRVAAAVRPLLSAFAASTARHIYTLGWCEAVRRVVLYIAISVLELQLLVTGPVLWLAVPGLIFLPCLGLEVALIWLLVLRLNKDQQHMFTCANEGTKNRNHLDGQDHQRWYWIVVGGTDLDAEETRQTSIPRLANLFGHDMHVFIPYRLGLPLDIAVVLVQRTVQVPTARSAALYRAVRAQLLRTRTSGVRIIAHNTGALDTAWVLSRLCADLPSGDLLGKLQVFTFGAAAAEMTIPLGALQQNDSRDNPGYPTITHFAFEDDPFAQIGVFLGVRHRLEGRFVGSLYTIRSSRVSGWSKSRLLPRGRSYTLEDYLDALFPGGDPRAGVLGQVCRIDREVSEMRELAALAQSVSHIGSRTRANTKRLSWTVLGAVADSLSHGDGEQSDMAGAFSLNEVRRRGKSLEGMRGYENNALVDAVASVETETDEDRDDLNTGI